MRMTPESTLASVCMVTVDTAEGLAPELSVTRADRTCSPDRERWYSSAPLKSITHLKEVCPRILRSVFFFSKKKTGNFTWSELWAQTIFFHGTFFKPTLLDLKRTNLAFVMAFLPSAARYSQKKWPSSKKFCSKIAKIEEIRYNGKVKLYQKYRFLGRTTTKWFEIITGWIVRGLVSLRK